MYPWHDLSLSLTLFFLSNPIKFTFINTYIQIITRPNITYIVHKLSQFMATPWKPHFDAVLQYIKGCLGQEIFFFAEFELYLKAFAEWDYAFCIDSRRSTRGYCIFLGDSFISWRIKKQTIVSWSSTKKEYRAMVVCDLTWLVALLKDFKIDHSKLALLFCDNQVELHIDSNPTFHVLRTYFM